LVLAISLLASVYGALYFARRLVVPIQQLMQGTRAVARGDFDTRVPSPARDEIGFLVNSFNDMTQRLAKASQEASSSQQKLESERKKLELILARLSTGVVSLEPDMRIRTANQAAGAILGVDLESYVGQSLVELAHSRPLLAQFLSVEANHLEHGDTEWREQIVLRGDLGRRVLMCACTELPGADDTPSGYVIVFDDITALLQAQRDAAWGEVARRLAHEIKNPLTPIQLSAERLRKKYSKNITHDRETFDRLTTTIERQVTDLKTMVDEFAEFARMPKPEMGSHDLRHAVQEPVVLFREGHSEIDYELRIPDKPLLMSFDRRLITRAVTNLVKNASEAVEAAREAAQKQDPSWKGRVETIVTPQSDRVTIEVIDNGIGLP
jgi:two-component system nitrogen regulation sensor histidine kinase NtrY